MFAMSMYRTGISASMIDASKPDQFAAVGDALKVGKRSRLARAQCSAGVRIALNCGGIWACELRVQNSIWRKTALMRWHLRMVSVVDCEPCAEDRDSFPSHPPDPSDWIRNSRLSFVSEKTTF